MRTGVGRDVGVVYAVDNPNADRVAQISAQLTTNNDFNDNDNQVFSCGFWVRHVGNIVSVPRAGVDQSTQINTGVEIELVRRWWHLNLAGTDTNLIKKNQKTKHSGHGVHMVLLYVPTL